MILKTIAAEGKSAAHQSDAVKASPVKKNYSTSTSQSTINLNQLFAQVDLADLASQAGAKLQRTGNTLRGACPLHKGNNPTAFSIYTDDTGRQRWHCHTGCNAGGDTIDFVRRWKNLDFIETTRWLAEQAGLSMEKLGMNSQSTQVEVERRARNDLFAETARCFSDQLWSAAGKAAREYLHQRGFTDQTLRESNWGFSTSDQALRTHLQKSKADIGRAKEAGILRADGRDFTANADGRQASPAGYIIFPHTLNGHVASFSARALKPIDPNDKSRNLPGERQLYWALVPGNASLVIVEGQADAESLRQIGRSAVALCGVGNLSETDLARIRKKRVVYLALDHDSLKPDLEEEKREKIRLHKIETTNRLCDALGPLSMIIPELPFKDLNEWLQNGLTAAAWESHLSTAQPYLDLLIEQISSLPIVEQDEQIQKVTRFLRDMPDTLQTRYMNQLERKFGLGRKELRKMMRGEDQGANNLSYAEIKDKRLHFMGDPLGNFWARITHELSVDDGLNPPSVRYQLQGGLANGEALQTVSIEARELGKIEWIPSQWGVRAIPNLPPSKGHILARAIQEVSLEDVIRERLFTFTGWVDYEGKRGYLTTSGLLTADGLDTSVRVDLGTNNLSHYALSDPPRDKEAQQKAVDATLDFLRVGPRHVTAPLWAAMYAAPLTIFRSLNAVVNIYGTTQSGKSTASHLAQTHFGTGFIQGRDYHAPMDWTSTVTSIEGAMFTTKDAPIIIDDFAPQFASQSDARDMHRKASLMVRSVGNRSARSRSRADLSQQTTRFPRGLVLMTAENPLVGQSIVGRMVYVPIALGDVLPDGNGDSLGNRLSELQVQAQAGLLSQAMSLYIQYLARHWAEIAAEFPKLVDSASEVARAEKSLQNRLPDAFGILHAAQELALRVFHELGLLDEATAKQIAEENRVALLDLIVGQAERIAAESPVQKLFEALGSLLERGKVYLAPRTKMVEFFPPDDAELIGYFEPLDKSVIYLRTDICLAQAKQFWRGLDQNLDIMPDALRRQVGQIPNLLAEKDPRQTEILKYCLGVNQRVLVVDARKVQEFYGVTFSSAE
jgi:DNA primase catalytic core